MKCVVKVVVSIVVALFFFDSYAFEAARNSDSNPAPDQSGERSVRGGFISFDISRLLKASVGEYALSALVVVDDKRNPKFSSSKVVITLQGSAVKSVVIC